jgi:predicted nucleic acid-binding protein
MIAYLDSSVLLRVILQQQNRLPQWDTIDCGVASVLAEVECLRTLDRLKTLSRLSDAQLAERRESVFRLLGEMSIVDIDRPILTRASQPLPTPLGTLDAIHLATAFLWRERGNGDLVMATHDTSLGIAARSLGFTVIGI